MTYCVSDIHGDYDKYKRLLHEIEWRHIKRPVNP